MPRSFMFYIAFFTLTLFSCGSEKTLDKNLSCEDDTACRTLIVGEETRTYFVYIPSSYDDNNATPLLINFHGFGGSAEDFANDIGGGSSNLNSFADAHNFIVVYPQGVERSKGDSEWDPGDNGATSIIDNDVFFVDKLIENISQEWNIDPLRIYASGYSNGGMMAYGLACNRADVFAAIGVMSGTMLIDEGCDLSLQTSIIIFHGIEDNVLPYNGDQNFQSLSAVIDYWLGHNDISSSTLESTLSNNGDILRDIYADNSRNLSITSYTVNNEYDKPGGHVWFTDDINDKHPNEILWEFLSAHRLDD